MNRLQNYFFLLLSLGLAFTLPSNAQVTIGSGKAPAKAALLQIKDTEPDLGTISLVNNVTATKGGLAFPRVSLLENDKLEPFLMTPTNKEKMLLTGLVVYNLSALFDSKGKEFRKGLYLWDGNKWNEMVFLD